MYDKEEMDTNITENTSKGFTFSRPNVVFSPPKSFNYDFSTNFISPSSSKQTFSFAAPEAISQLTNYTKTQSNETEKKYKPKISRNAFEPSVNVFAHALKDSSAFEQLAKNSRSHIVKFNLDNSITCTNVPKELLIKSSAKEYFHTYGQIMKITIKPKKQIIIVFYASKEEANNAYQKSGEYLGKKFLVEWTKSEKIPKSPTKKKELKKNIVTNFLKLEDEIRTELEAMTNLEYNLPDYKSGDIYRVPSIGKRGKGSHVKKSEKILPKIEKVAAKVDKVESDSQIMTSLHGASVEELQSIIHQISITSEDKYKILEARDRLMRLKQVKSHSLATAKITSGTCPDMCPEKERLMRESQRQVAPYEQLEGNEYRINHMIAVKQYSRSSADQEEPMAHELRPVKSLKMTMSYLLHEIVNLCEEEGTNLGEWYHFLWDRTRGIRKDITQQELCCIDSVELVEQCARFHIVCSERLCAEELSVFDKKINSENLTKCLQSLKYMYHDLRVKGITCQNEPEFRAYIILLNLNNGNFMSDLQQLPTSIQKSPEVQFAINIYSTLESNNYYKFFKLVRQTTYLNACILLRYFNQVRVKALSIMVKAYCRTTSTAYPLYELLHNLGFENENETICFCEQVGINVSSDELYVMLNRQNFCLPMSNIQQGRAHYMIESKRTSKGLSISECIAGGKMPEKSYKNHKPHSSFDSEGYLMPQSINAEDQNSSIDKSVVKLISHEIIEKESEPSEKEILLNEKNHNTFPIDTPTTKYYDHFQKLTKINDTNLNKSETITAPVSQSEHNIITSKSEQITSESKIETNLPSDTQTQQDYLSTPIIFNKTCYDTLPKKLKDKNSISNNTSNNASLPQSSFNVLHQTKPTETFEMTSPFLMTVNKSIFSETGKGNIFTKSTVPCTIFDNNVSNVSFTSHQSISSTKFVPSEQTAPINKNMQSQNKLSIKKEPEIIGIKQMEQKMQQINKDTEEIFEELIEKVIEEPCSTILQEEINRSIMYNSLSNNMLTCFIDEMCDAILFEEITSFQKVEEFTKKRNERKINKYFHVWKTWAFKKNQQRKALDNTPVWLQKQSIDECAKILYRDGQKLVIENMCKRQCTVEVPKSPIINNLAPIEVIIYAGIKENLKSLNMHITTNLFWKVVISWPHLENKTDLWQYKKIINRYLCPEDYTVEPIIKSFQPNPYENLHICIRYFEGFIAEHNLFGTDGFIFIATASENAISVNKRLTKTILSREKLVPIPLVFIILGNGGLETEKEKIVTDLDTLLESGYISEYTITVENTLNETVILNLIQSTILWLAINKPPKNPLEMDSLQNLCDICITEEFWQRVLEDSIRNANLSESIKDPNFLINLHNEAVAHLIHILLDPESLMYTKFSPELKKFVRNQCISPCSYEYFDDVWRTVEYRVNLENIISGLILPHWSFPWPVTDVHQLHQNIIHYCQIVLPDINNHAFSCDILSHLYFMTGSIQVMNFADILVHIVKEKISFIETDLKVVYNKNYIKYFKTLPWWFKSTTFAEFTSKINLDETCSIKRDNIITEPVQKKRKLKDCSDSTFEDDDVINEFDPLAEFCDYTKNKIIDVHRSSQLLENRLKEQQLENRRLEEKIKNAVLPI
ncbi:XMAS2 protein [Vespula maculifrons]|uniref:XMAS2 protein n=1 Tax=Vespula maculifrons TaxID=7453 RepID=A0ABD2CH23_VESMC